MFWGTDKRLQLAFDAADDTAHAAVAHAGGIPEQTEQIVGAKTESLAAMVSLPSSPVEVPVTDSVDPFYAPCPVQQPHQMPLTDASGVRCTPSSVETSHKAPQQNLTAPNAASGAEDSYLRVVRRHAAAHIPHRATDGSAGYDLYSAHNVTIPPYQR